MNPSQFGLVSSIFTLGGLAGALCGGPISAKYGRLLAMRLSTIFFIIGPVFEALASSIAVMSLGRFLSGIGAGCAIVVVPIYISEIAPPREKGMFGALTQVMINLGILFSQTLGYFLSKGYVWRIVLAVGGGIGIVLGLGLCFVPESPKWTAIHRDTASAIQTLRRIRGHNCDIEEETKDWDLTPSAAREYWVDLEH